MRHTFLRHRSGSSELLLFFSGWGSEPGMFIPGSDTGPGRDILMLWDYRDMTLDPDLLLGYGRISLLAWSMGVWAAGKALGEAGMVNGPRLAVNGTPFPIDDGNGLSERTLAKFRRRMCGSSETLESLLACGLNRSAEELRDELAAIGDRARGTVSSPLRWDKALVGDRDMIFPPAGQHQAWHTTMPACSGGCCMRMSYGQDPDTPPLCPLGAQLRRICPGPADDSRAYVPYAQATCEGMSCQRTGDRLRHRHIYPPIHTAFPPCTDDPQRHLSRSPRSPG